jgi:hypothetical protein
MYRPQEYLIDGSTGSACSAASQPVVHDEVPDATKEVKCIYSPVGGLPIGAPPRVYPYGCVAFAGVSGVWKGAEEVSTGPILGLPTTDTQMSGQASSKVYSMSGYLRPIQLWEVPGRDARYQDVRPLGFPQEISCALVDFRYERTGRKGGRGREHCCAYDATLIRFRYVGNELNSRFHG